MNFDVFTTAAVVDELNRHIQGGRVQDSVELGEAAVGLEIYANQKRQYLLISAHPTEARVHLVPEKLRRGVETPSPLGLMLRRYVEESWLKAIHQPAWERIVHLDFDGPNGPFTLIVEPMERRSNLLLVRDGRIMDCVRRVGPDENRVRVSLPGHEYMPPPPQLGKRPPTELDQTLIAHALDADAGKAAWRVLTDLFLGFSPMLAKEAVFRAMGRANNKAGDTSAHDLFAAAQELVTPLLEQQWQSGYTESDGQITSYAAFPVTHLDGWHPTESISEALANFYGTTIGIEAYDTAKQPIREALADAIEKVSRRLEGLKRSYRDESERERLKQSGELILAYQYQIKAGQTSFSAQYDFDQPALDIALDPTLNAVENAKAYFERYEKAKRGAAELPTLITLAEHEVAFLQQLSIDLELAANWPEMGEVQDALQANGYWKGTKTGRPKGGKSAPIKVVTPEGIVIWVGRNSRQNEDVTFTKGRPEDLWLHARGVPGAHVVIKTNGRSVPTSVIQKAAGFAAYYSASRTEGHALVDVTERRHVRKIKGGKAGMVTYKNESPIEVVPTEAPKS
jgi:predicted ribosome quality control (RQC) complex YloA/Tae2 family protein